MHIAVIDIGTLTFHLLIVRINKDNTFDVVYKEKDTVKLGKKGINNREISYSAFELGINTLLYYNEIIRNYNCKRVNAFATSAMRNADNRTDFINKVYDYTGIRIQAISGDYEAELIYKGCKNAYKMESPALIVDIGGGSIEFILGDNKNMLWKKSFEIGIIRLYEKIKPSEPITQEDIFKLNKCFEPCFNEVYNEIIDYNVDTLIGCSGTFIILASILQKNYPNSQRRNKSYYKINKSNLYHLHNYLINTTLNERYSIKGIDASRAEYIVIASIFIIFMVEKLKLKKIIQSDYALKEGIIFEELASILF